MDLTIPLRTEILRHFSEIEALQERWDQLWQQSAVREVFTQFGWCRAAWKTYGREGSLLCPAVYRGDELVGLLPLLRRSGRLQFITADRSDYNDILCAEQYAPQVVTAALGALLAEKSWSYCRFDNLPERSHMARCYPAVAEALGISLSLWPREICPTAIFPEDSRKALLESILRKKSLNRHRRKLAALGDVRFRHIESRQEILTHLPRFFEQHRTRRRQAGDQSLFASQRAQEFYRHLLEEFDPRSTLRFGVLELDGRTVAYHFGFQSQGKFIWYKPSFDVTYSRFGPGEVLIWHLFQYAAEQGLHEFDFTVGDEAFKSRFATHMRRNSVLYFFRPGISGAVRKAALHSLERSRRHPRLVRMYRFLRRSNPLKGNAAGSSNSVGMSRKNVASAKRKVD